MKSALVIGASGGIGAAVVARLTAQGVAVTTLSRRDDGFDVTDSASVAAGLGALRARFDLVFVAVGVLAAGGAPEKSLAAIDAAQMQKVFAVNAVGPALILSHAAGLLAPAGKIAVLSARVGSIGDNRIGGWHSYRASKAALNQIVRGAAIELARSVKDSVVLALHPGTVATPFTARYAGRHKTVTADAAAERLMAVIAQAGPQQSGGFYDYAGDVVPW